MAKLEVEVNKPESEKSSSENIVKLHEEARKSRRLNDCKVSSRYCSDGCGDGIC